MLVTVEEVGEQREVHVAVRDGEPLLVADPRLLSALSMLPAEPFTFAQVKHLWSTEGLADLVDQLWSVCRATEMVVHEPDRDLGPYAAYHGAIRTYPFLEDGAVALTEGQSWTNVRQVDTNVQPSPYLELERRSRRGLVKAERVRHKAGQAALSPVEEVSLLLDGTFGERRRWDGAGEGGGRLSKAIPSGGGQHPTEVLAYLRCEGFQEGLYHYSVAANGLDHLLAQPGLGELEAVCPALRDVLRCGPSALMVVSLACRVERTMRHYREPHSFRTVGVDMGHAIQHLAELGHALGWWWVDLPGFDAEELGKRLSLPSEALPVLAMGVLCR
ncbi:hypothetical protein [Streptomyces albidoflavus]|uniref:hypothetical protein n=1 Tax=Streptomyces albidoflavus TaxID=1886 RepID=UPI0010229E91|nr:hypothetical protein [Streptomyces albidoflavus]RZF02835.1 hypothetical protein C0R05_31975 [Streptomyces albidoflavus]